MTSWKHRPRKPSLDTLEKWSTIFCTVAAWILAAFVLWFLA